MFAINERCYMELKINDQLVPVDGSLLAELTIIENIQMVLPLLKLHLNDLTGNTLEEYPIVDGTKISVTIGADQNKETASTTIFRVAGSPPSDSGRGSPLIKVRAVLDAPLYLSGQPTRSFTGTSSAVASQIAELCGLGFEGDPTDDSMKWLPFNRRYASFVAMLSDHGWASDSSLMLFGVTADRKLHFHDVDRIISKKPKSVYYYGDPPEEQDPKPQRVAERQIRVNSGTLNNWVGYGYRVHQTGLNGQPSSHESVEATRLNNHMDQSTDVRSTVGNVRREYAPPDCGNTHRNFIKARHQNRRLRALYGTDVDVLCEHVTEDTLFDLVNFKDLNQVTRNTNASMSGAFVVTAKARMIVGNGYYEKLVLTGQGRQNSPSSSPTV